MEELWNLIQQEDDENTIISCINKRPELCSILHKGQYPVQYAVQRLLSVKVIKKMISYYPQACKKCNSKGNLLLHHAIFTRHSKFAEIIVLFHDASLLYKSSDMILEIIDSCPYAVKVKNNDGKLPLHLECDGYCRDDIIKKLVHIYPQAINVPIVNDCLPLHMALYNDNCLSDTVCFLLGQNPASACSKDDCGNFPLHIECQCQCRFDIIVKLLEQHSEAICMPNCDNEFPLDLAISNNDSSLEAILFLISHHSKATYVKCYVDVDDGIRQTPLHLECKYKCRYDVVLKLLELHPECINIPIENGMLPLHVALKSSSNDSTAVVLYLINAFPDAVRIAVRGENLALHIECLFVNRFDIIIKLLEIYPEAISKANNRKEFPLHMILKSGHRGFTSDTIFHLIALYPEATLMKDIDGDLPLHNECKNRCRYDVIKKLLDISPESIKITNEMTRLPLHIAGCTISKISSDVINYLIGLYPEAVEFQDINGEQPLHIEIRHQCRYDIVLKLLELDPCALTIWDRDGNIPLVVAISKYKPDVIHLILDGYPAAASNRYRSDNRYVYPFWLIFAKYYEIFNIRNYVGASKLISHLKLLAIEMLEVFPYALYIPMTGVFVNPYNDDPLGSRLLLEIVHHYLLYDNASQEYYDLNYQSRDTLLHLLFQLSNNTYSSGIFSHLQSSHQMTRRSGPKKQSRNENAALHDVLKSMVAAAGRDIGSNGSCTSWMKSDDLGCTLLRKVVLYL